jgi:hypothetical protein
MNTDDLIKKAAERGIALDRETAEKYTSLSDEELANLDISGGAGDCNESKLYPIGDMIKEAENCPYFELNNTDITTRKCIRCKYIATGTRNYTQSFCKHPKKCAGKK